MSQSKLYRCINILYCQAKFWNNVYGFDMSPFGTNLIKRERRARDKPEIMSLCPDQILSDPQIYAELDLHTITQKDLNALNKKHFVSVRQVSQLLTLAQIRITFKLYRYCDCRTYIFIFSIRMENYMELHYGLIVSLKYLIKHQMINPL